jgi:hypothetical protein
MQAVKCNPRKAGPGGNGTVCDFTCLYVRSANVAKYTGLG